MKKILRLPFVSVCGGMLLCVGALVPARAGGLDAGDQSANAGPEQAAPEEAASAVLVSGQAGAPSKGAIADAEGLRGRDAKEVESVLGKPAGKLQTGQGVLWLYSEWRVQFDKHDQVLKIEKDQPVHLARLDPQFVAAAEAYEKAVAARAAERVAAEAAARAKAALEAEKVRVVSNGGQEVNLASLLREGKITVVDFYADWGGPCRPLGPRLEQLGKDDPKVVPLKINIVDWKAPVSRQFGIESIPNVRVFNRSKSQVGDSTSDLNQVIKRVEQAKGT